MKVINQNVLVKVFPKNKPSETGIVFPDQMESEGLEKAEVISVSMDLKDRVSEGDTILIYKGHGKEFTNPENNEKYRVVNVSEILVVL